MVSVECGHGHTSPWVENLAGLPLTARITWGSREGFRRETLGRIGALKDEKKAGKGKNHPEVRSPGWQGMVTRGRGENRLDAGVVGLRAGSWWGMEPSFPGPSRSTLQPSPPTGRPRRLTHTDLLSGFRHWESPEGDWRIRGERDWSFPLRTPVQSVGLMLLKSIGPVWGPLHPTVLLGSGTCSCACLASSGLKATWVPNCC